MNKTLGNALKFLLFVGVGVGILYLMYRNQQAAYLEQCQLDGVAEADCSLLDRIAGDFRSANPLWLLLTLVAFSVSNLSRAIRWNMLLRTFGKKPRLINAFLTINLGYFANLGFPRLGEVVRPAAMARYENISLERVVGTVVVGRTVDVIFILLVTGLALLFGREMIWNWLVEEADVLSKLAGWENLLIAAGVLGVLALALVWWQRERLLATGLGQKVLGVAKGFAEGLQAVAKVDSPALFLFHSVVIWVMYFLMTWCVFQSFAPTADLSPTTALVTFVSGGWGIVIPSPGGMGTYHYLTGAALELYGVDGLDAFSWSNISFFTINIGCNVLIGLIALLALPRINRDYVPAETDVEVDVAAP